MRASSSFLPALLFCALFVLICSPAWAVESAGTNLLSADLRAAGLEVSALEQTSDPERKAPVEAIRARPDADWSHHKRAYPTFGFTRAAHWFRFSVRNPNAQATPAVLRIAFEHVDHIEVFVFAEGQELHHAFGGREHDFSTREFAHIRHAFALSLPPGSSTVLLMVRSGHALNVPLGLLSPAEYAARESEEIFRLHAYFAAIAFLFLLNCLFYYAFRDSHLLIYLAYVFFGAATQFAVQGYGMRYLWGAYPAWNALSLTFFTMLFGISILFFCQRFLGTALHLPVTHRLLSVLILMSCTQFVLLAFVPYRYTEMLINYFYMPVAEVVCIMAGVKMLLRGSREARFYLVGWSLFFVLSLVYLAQNTGLLPNGFFYGIDMYEFLLLGTLCEMALFPVAIADRIRVLVREQSERPGGDGPTPGGGRRPTSRLTRVDLKALRGRLYTLMNEQEVYREELSLGDLAGRIGISEKDLSEFLNQEERKSFYQFINEFRVQAARIMLVENPRLKIIEIAHSVGFGSLSTFNSAFQKLTGTSPREYRKRNLVESA